MCERSLPKASFLCWALLQIEKAKQPPEGQPWTEKADTQEVRTRQSCQGLLLPDPCSPLPLLLQVSDLGALSRTCGLIQQLHVAYSTLASSLQGLPAELQQQVRQARHSLCELHGVVSSASSIAELPAERLAQSRENVGRAWQGLEKLLESVQHSPPLSWLVGPFDLHPSGQQL